jgi:hypothetical protein
MLSNGKLEEGMTLRSSTIRVCGILVDITTMYPVSLNRAVIAEDHGWREPPPSLFLAFLIYQSSSLEVRILVRKACNNEEGPS